MDDLSKKRIWKYEMHNVFGSKDVSIDRVVMPSGADILTVQTQNGWPTIWAMVRPQNEKINRIFHVLPTGTAPENDDYISRLRYLGTMQFTSGQLIYHVFDGGEEYIDELKPLESNSEAVYPT